MNNKIEKLWLVANNNFKIGYKDYMTINGYNVVKTDTASTIEDLMEKKYTLKTYLSNMPIDNLIKVVSSNGLYVWYFGRNIFAKRYLSEFEGEINIILLGDRNARTYLFSAFPKHLKDLCYIFDIQSMRFADIGYLSTMEDAHLNKVSSFEGLKLPIKI